jgi:hypothetical protein
MPVYPGATYRPIPIHDASGGWARSNGPMHSHRGAVLHVNQSNGNLFNYISTNSGGTSCHFEVYKTGVVEQYIDTQFSSWCQTDGNDDWVSIETEGYATEPLTAQQLTAITGLYGWLHAVHGIPLQLADTVAGTGFGWHGMGGGSWGGHTGCPGDLRKPQRQTVLDLLTKPTPTPAPTEESMPKQFWADANGDGKADVMIAESGGSTPGVLAGGYPMGNSASNPINQATLTAMKAASDALTRMSSTATVTALATATDPVVAAPDAVIDPSSDLTGNLK